MREKFIAFFDFVIYWALILLPFSMSIASAPASVFMGWLYFSFIMKKVLKKEGILTKNIPIMIPFLAFFIAAEISLFNSNFSAVSMRGLIKLIQYPFIFIVFSEELRDKKHLKRILFAMILGITLASIDAIWQVFTGHDFIRGRETIVNIGLKRATASFSDSNVLGVYLSAIIPLFAVVCLNYLKGKARFFATFVLGIALVGLLLTYSRPSLLAVYVAILIFSIAKKKKLILWILILLALFAPFLAPKSLKDWAKSVNYNPIVFMCNHDRVAVYLNAMNMISQHPAIGVGVNTFNSNYSKYKLASVEEKWGRTPENMYAHNNFLQMTGEIGFLGLAMFLWLLVALFKDLIMVQRKLYDDFLKIVHFGIAISIISFLINGLTETSLYYGRVCMIFWYLIGLSLGIRNFNAENK